MKTDNIKSQMRKGVLEYCILLLLHQRKGVLEYCILLLLHQRKAYSSDIIIQLKQASLIVVEGTLYPLLTRLKNDGLLNYEWVESTQGPPRKYYSLTAEGEECLLELERAWTELNNTISFIHTQKQ